MIYYLKLNIKEYIKQLIIVIFFLMNLKKLRKKFKGRDELKKYFEEKQKKLQDEYDKIYEIEKNSADDYVDLKNALVNEDLRIKSLDYFRCIKYDYVNKDNLQNLILDFTFDIKIN